MFGLGGPEVAAIVVLSLFVILPFWKIFSKAGFSGLMSIAMLIPLLNFVMLLFLAYSEWPILKELKALKQKTQS
jgi:hypothetical protein